MAPLGASVRGAVVGPRGSDTRHCGSKSVCVRDEKDRLGPTAARDIAVSRGRRSWKVAIQPRVTPGSGSKVPSGYPVVMPASAAATMPGPCTSCAAASTMSRWAGSRVVVSSTGEAAAAVSYRLNGLRSGDVGSGVRDRWAVRRVRVRLGRERRVVGRLVGEPCAGCRIVTGAGSGLGRGALEHPTGERLLENGPRSRMSDEQDPPGAARRSRCHTSEVPGHRRGAGTTHCGCAATSKECRPPALRAWAATVRNSTPPEADFGQFDAVSSCVSGRRRLQPQDATTTAPVVSCASRTRSSEVQDTPATRRFGSRPGTAHNRRATVRARLVVELHERGRAILGEAGIGKAALTAKIAQSAAAAGDLVVEPVRVPRGVDVIALLARALARASQAESVSTAVAARVVELLDRVRSVSGVQIAPRSAEPNPRVAFRELLIELGRVAAARGRMLLIRIDEVQNIRDVDQLSAVLTALADALAHTEVVRDAAGTSHERVLPIAVYLTALPEFLDDATAAAGATFARRLRPMFIGHLDDQDLELALMPFTSASGCSIASRNANANCSRPWPGCARPSGR